MTSTNGISYPLPHFLVHSLTVVFPMYVLKLWLLLNMGMFFFSFSFVCFSIDEAERLDKAGMGLIFVSQLGYSFRIELWQSPLSWKVGFLWRRIWHISCLLLIVFTCQSYEEISNPHCENLLEFLERNPMNVCVGPLRLWPQEFLALMLVHTLPPNIQITF